MTKKSNVITPQETTGRNIEHNAQLNAKTYWHMVAQADEHDRQGNIPRANQARRSADEYYATRLGDRGRQIVDAAK